MPVEDELDFVAYIIAACGEVRTTLRFLQRLHQSMVRCWTIRRGVQGQQSEHSL